MLETAEGRGATRVRLEETTKNVNATRAAGATEAAVATEAADAIEAAGSIGLAGANEAAEIVVIRG